MHVISIKKFMYWKCIFALYLNIQVWYKIIESKRILRLLKSWWIIDFLIFLGLSPWQVRQGNWRLIAVGYEMSVSWHTYHRLHIICNHFLKDKISIIQTVSYSPRADRLEPGPSNFEFGPRFRNILNRWSVRRSDWLKSRLDYLQIQVSLSRKIIL